MLLAAIGLSASPANANRGGHENFYGNARGVCVVPFFPTPKSERFFPFSSPPRGREPREMIADERR
jgi:hypothetical protein